MEIQVKIQGIHCAGCLSRLQQSLKSVGVIRFDFDFETKMAQIYCDDDDFSPKTITETIENLGYNALWMGEVK